MLTDEEFDELFGPVLDGTPPSQWPERTKQIGKLPFDEAEFQRFRVRLDKAIEEAKGITDG